MHKVAFGCGITQAIALGAFAVSVLIKDTNDNGVRGSTPHPYILFTIFMLFAGAIALVSSHLLRRSTWTRTPFIMIQVFALLVFAYLPLNGSGNLAHLAGASVAVISVVALAALWRTDFKG